MAPVAEPLADRYELGVRLGSGGMGDVYRARDRRLDRTVAVKVPSSTLTPASAERFKREAQAAARLNHPNIVSVYDWGDGATPFIVMEYVQGRSLRAELRDRGPLPPATVVAVGAQIADALAHAHAHGVVHRDVKPSNVVLTPDGAVKVTDFGIAQSTIGEALTESGVVFGTIGYLSPEQVAGLPVDARSDVYSLGVVLTELLTGERPLGAVPPSTDLERVIARARDADPAARFATATDLRDALRAADTATDAAVAAVVVDTDATARATGAAPTSLMPAALMPAAAVVMVTPPARAAPDPVSKPKGRRFRRAKRTYPKVARVPKPPKSLKSPKPAKALKPLKPKRGASAVRTWHARHWAVILAAPLLVIVGGVLAYAKLTERAPSVAVPDVVDHDVFSAFGALKNAGFEWKVKATDSPRPVGTVLAQDPANGQQLEEGSTVYITVARATATVPDVVTMNIEAAKVALGRRGLSNLLITLDYRDDVDPGTVMSTKPGAYVEATKRDALEVVVAADPHVKMPNVVGLDQATATASLHDLGLDVAVQTSSSKSAPAGRVLKSDPSDGDTAVRGDTVTLTVSSGPKQIAVPAIVGWNRDDAVGELEDRGFAVVVKTAAASGDQIDAVLAQEPVGGRASEGSTVTITVGVKAKKG